MPEDETRLSACIDAACSTDVGLEAEEKRNAAQSELQGFLWQARAARDVLNATTADPDERTKAACHWALLYRLFHAWREQRKTRLDYLESLAVKAGIAPLRFYLREFALNVGNAILVSPDPVKKLDGILHGPARRGRKQRTFNQRIEIAAAAEKLRGGGMTFAKAYETVANTLGKSENFTSDAIRIIHERAMKDSATASLVRLVATGLVEL